MVFAVPTPLLQGPFVVLVAVKNSQSTRHKIGKSMRSVGSTKHGRNNRHKIIKRAGQVAAVAGFTESRGIGSGSGFPVVSAC